jgi:hypothetical protein
MHFSKKIIHLMIFFFINFFDTTLTFCFSPHFSFSFLCNKRSVIISKVHYKLIVFLEFIQKIYDDFD